ESNFSQFGNYGGHFGPFGLPASTTVVVFGDGPVTKGATIAIHNRNMAIYSIPQTNNISVTVSSVSPTSFTFTTDPGHVLYPASITFSAADAGNGQISFTIKVNGDFAGPVQELGYYFA